jgi:hypothetical protein
MFNFLTKRNKFPNFVVVYCDTSRCLEIWDKELAKKIIKHNENDFKLLTLEQSFLFKDTNKYFSFNQGNPTELIQYVINNVPAHMIPHYEDGSIIGHEFEDVNVLEKK